MRFISIICYALLNFVLFAVFAVGLAMGGQRLYGEWGATYGVLIAILVISFMNASDHVDLKRMLAEIAANAPGAPPRPEPKSDEYELWSVDNDTHIAVQEAEDDETAILRVIIDNESVVGIEYTQNQLRTLVDMIDVHLSRIFKSKAAE